METTVLIEKLNNLQIGREGDSEALTLNIDMSSWAEEFGSDVNLACYVLFRMPDQEQGWPVTSSWNSTTKVLTWPVLTNCTAVEGTGFMEVRAIDANHDPEYTYDGLVKKSKTVPVLIENSITRITGDNIPSVYQDFLNQVLAIKTELNGVFAGATTHYVLSTSYNTTPVSGWSETMPDLTLATSKGKYLWTRLGFDWGTTNTPTYLYTVNYVALDGDGSVDSVNGKTGNVTLYGTDITVGGGDTRLVSTVLSNKLDASKIIYRATAPVGPVTGTIWLKPKE